MAIRKPQNNPEAVEPKEEAVETTTEAPATEQPAEKPKMVKKAKKLSDTRKKAVRVQEKEYPSLQPKDKLQLAKEMPKLSWYQGRIPFTKKWIARAVINGLRKDAYSSENLDAAKLSAKEYVKAYIEGLLV